MKFVDPIATDKLTKAYDDLMTHLMTDTDNIFFKELIEAFEECALEILSEAKARLLEGN